MAMMKSLLECSKYVTNQSLNLSVPYSKIALKKAFSLYFGKKLIVERNLAILGVTTFLSMAAIFLHEMKAYNLLFYDPFDAKL